MRTVFIAFLIFILFAVFASAQQPSEFLISFWCGPSLTAENYFDIASAGFNVAGPVCAEYSLDFNKQLLELCQKNGLKALIQDHRLSAKPEDPDFESNLDAVIADYSNHPALYGYLLADEPSASEFYRLAAVNQYLLKKDPKHIPFINIFPNYVPAEKLGSANYDDYLKQFISIVKPVLVSYDNYSLIPGDEREVWWENLESVRKECLAADKPFVVIILATPHGPYRDPNDADLRWQAYSSAAYGAKGILYFTYITPSAENEWNYRNGILDANNKKSAKYAHVKQLNHELKTLGKILIGLKSTAVYHFGKLPAGTIPPPQKALVTSKDEDLLVGEFIDKTGANYILAVNRDPRKSRDIIFSVRKAKKLAEMMKDGKSRIVAELEYGYDISVRSRFLPGEGKLFKILE